MNSIETIGLAAAPKAPQSKAAPPEAPVQAPQPAQPARADTLIVASGGENIESHFSVDQDTHEMVVRVVDATTQEVIRELPPETIRNLSASLARSIGRQMDAKA